MFSISPNHPILFFQTVFHVATAQLVFFIRDYSTLNAELGIWQVENKAIVVKVIVCFNFYVISKKFVQDYAMWS